MRVYEKDSWLEGLACGGTPVVVPCFGDAGGGDIGLSVVAGGRGRLVEWRVGVVGHYCVPCGGKHVERLF